VPHCDRATAWSSSALGDLFERHLVEFTIKGLPKVPQSIVNGV
jgi:hypothetical protein